MTFDLGRVVQTVVLTAAGLFIAFGLLRPLLVNPARSEAFVAQAALAADAPAGREPSTGLPGPLEAADDSGAVQSTAVANEIAAQNAPAASLPAPPALAETADDPVLRLRRLIEEREEETVEILRAWMDEDEDRLT